MKLKISIFILCSLLLSSFIQAQTAGAHRNGIEWKEIKTPAANIIFAPEMEYQANRVANIVNYMRENNSLSIGPHRHKIDILIRNETIIPNGYVALGPFRSEFFATPPDRFNRIGATDWIEHLAIHEYRHVMQSANEKVGITKLFYYLLGESAWNGLKFFSIPQWVSEGDAVTMETSLTNSGRGRMPFFTRGLRALALEETNLTYAKWRNGSYDELMPDSYPFGYMLLSHLRNNKGSKVSGDILRDGAGYNKIFYPYSAAMKSKTGWTTSSLYKDAWKHFGDQWRAEVNALQLTPTKKITKDAKVVTNYCFPQFGKNNQIIALKNSYNETDKLVTINGSLESPLTSIGFSYSDYFNVRNEIITWTEYSQNARRSNTQFSNIYTFDVKNSKKTKLTKKGRYFSPSLSSNAARIVAVHIAPDLQNTLQILNAEDGQIEREISVADGASITRPIFIENDKSIAYIIKKDNYIWLESVHLGTFKSTEITPKSGHIIDAISTYGNYIYCSASFTGIDNIFRVPIDGNQRIEQITSVPIGAYEPSVSDDGKTLLFTEYTTRGQMISSMELNDSRQFKEIQLEEPEDMPSMDEVSAIEEGGEILSKTPNKVYKSENYKGLFKGLKLHSWGFSPTSAELEAGLQFNNILDDFSIFLGGGVNLNEDRNYYFLNAKVAKYYPVFNLRANKRGRAIISFTEADTFAIQQFDELNFGGDIALPFTWVDGNYFKNVQIGIGVDSRNLHNIKIKEAVLQNKKYTTSHVFFQFSSLRRTAYQNVRPRFGIAFSGLYSSNLSESGESKFIGTSRFYLPGLDYNHSLRLTTSYQAEKAKNKYQLSDNFVYPRGYRAPLNDAVYMLGLDYMFPIAYPDIGLWGIVYFKRLRMNLFYDIGQFQFKEVNFTDDFQSIGSDLYFDITTFNLIPSSLIVRYSYRLAENIIDPTGGEFRVFYSINF